MENKLFKKVMSYIFIIGLGYLTLSLINWNLNVGEWGWFSRLVLAIFAIATLVNLD